MNGDGDGDGDGDGGGGDAGGDRDGDGDGDGGDGDGDSLPRGQGGRGDKYNCRCPLRIALCKLHPAFLSVLTCAPLMTPCRFTGSAKAGAGSQDGDASRAY